jgi:proteic killer suppression protein
MIQSIKHKGLKRLWEKDDASKLPAMQLLRIRVILTQLDDADTKDDMNNPGYYLHELKGDLKGLYSVRVTGVAQHKWTDFTVGIG